MHFHAAGPIADLLGAPEEEGESSGSEGVGSQRSGESHDPEFLSHENMLSDSEEDDSDASEGSELEDESDESDSLILGFGGADNEVSRAQKGCLDPNSPFQVVAEYCLPPEPTYISSGATYPLIASFADVGPYGRGTRF